MDKDKLQKAYEAVEMLKALDLPVSKEQYESISLLEEGYLAKQIVPAIKKKLSPMVTGMKNDFRVEIHYIHDKGLSIDYVVKPTKVIVQTAKTPKHSPKSSKKQKKFILRVTFPDGYEVYHDKVAKTLAEVISRIGPENVMALNISNCRDNLIVTDANKGNQRNRYCLSEVGKGYYVNTLSSTDAKMVQIEQISNALHLGIKVEKVWL